jgi:hypothetical protein
VPPPEWSEAGRPFPVATEHQTTRRSLPRPHSLQWQGCRTLGWCALYRALPERRGVAPRRPSPSRNLSVQSRIEGLSVSLTRTFSPASAGFFLVPPIRPWQNRRPHLLFMVVCALSANNDRPSRRVSRAAADCLQLARATFDPNTHTSPTAGCFQNRPCLGYGRHRFGHSIDLRGWRRD